jgi:metal-sulfur cluster biosynthetic enzyme
MQAQYSSSFISILSVKALLKSKNCQRGRKMQGKIRDAKEQLNHIYSRTVASLYDWHTCRFQGTLGS